MTPIQTRRGFLATTAGAALTLAACGPSGTQTAKTVATQPGVFNHGNAAEPATLDPHFAEFESEDNIIGDLMMGLTTDNPSCKPIPGAAERWETSADGKTWTFHLRDHLWSDGTPVTAGDFVFAWQRILDPKTAAEYAYYLYLIKNAQAVNSGKLPAAALGITAPDDKTVVVELEHPAPYLTQYLLHFTTFPLPKHIVEAKGTAWSKPGNYVGNGAFLLAEWIPNEHITITKNPKFYDAANVSLDKVVFYPTSDYEAGLKRFRAGELDVQDRLPAAEIDWLHANMPETLHLSPVLVIEYLTTNLARKPFDDVRVREALSLAVDREALTQKIRKMGEVPAYNMVPPGIANYPGGVFLDFKSLPSPNRIKRAQELMMAAGYGPQNRFKTTLDMRAASADQLRDYVSMQAMWRPIYVDIDIVQNDTAQFYSKIQKGDFNIGAPAWGADFNDAMTFLNLLKTGNANNYGHYSNPKYDALLNEADSELDLTKRGMILAEAESIALKDNAWIPTLFWVSGAIVRPYVKNWIDNPVDFHRSRWISIDEQARAATKLV